MNTALYQALLALLVEAHDVTAMAHNVLGPVDIDPATIDADALAEASDKLRRLPAEMVALQYSGVR
ncbi:hypothetical protein [Bosea sp. TAF32]|uniref:hypothetical protein n=1 Tax=Bosea sp. TAF32 TaxID=3237482 RepID=UPI003F91F000